MTVSQKAALSLLVSVLLFAGFSVLAFTGLFNLIETKFYDPSITYSLNTELNHNAASVESFLNSQMARFSAALAEPSVRRSFLSNQTSDDIYERTKIFGAIQESIAGFQWARFIDSEGIRLNYSTYPSDILNQDSTFVAYRNYPGLSGALPYDTIASQDGDKGRIIFDQEGDRILISLPFYDFYEVYRGTALFSLSVRALSEQLINEGSIKAGDDVSVISDPQGVLIGRPAAAGKTLFPQVASVWNSGVLNLTAIEPVASSPQDSAVGLNTLALLSVKTNQGLFVGRLINEDVFSFPMPMKIILLISFFLTVYLIFFLLLNLRQDSVTIVQNRLKQLQISLIEQFYERKAAMDWSRWGLELEQRREEIRSELKKGIKDKTKNGESKNDIDQLIDKSWDELLAVIGGRRETSIDEKKLQLVLNRIMSAPQAEGNRPAVPAPQAESKSNEAELQPVDDAEELEELEEVESDEAAPVEELTELESANAEPVETLTELESADAEPAETLTELESADAEPVEAETLEELQEVESADAEPVETLTELESADAEPVETLTELESADAEPAETLTELEPADAEPAETLTELEPAEAETLEELQEVESDEPAPAEVLTELESADAEPVETLTELESADAEPEVLEELETAEPEENLTEELEELELLEDETAEELEELKEDENTPAVEEHSDVPVIDIDELARQIEFSEDTTANDEDDGLIFSSDLEIASPFKTMFTRIDESGWKEFESPEMLQDIEPTPAVSQPSEPLAAESQQAESAAAELPSAESTEPPAETPSAEPAAANSEDLPELEPANPEETEKKNFLTEFNPVTFNSDNTATLEALPAQTGSSYIYKPFFIVSNSDPQILQAQEDELPEELLEEVPEDAKNVIEEKDGIPFVNKTGIQNESAELNQEFKSLVDSIID